MRASKEIAGVRAVRKRSLRGEETTEHSLLQRIDDGLLDLVDLQIDTKRNVSETHNECDKMLPTSGL